MDPEKPNFVWLGPDGGNAIPIHVLANAGIAVFMTRGSKAFQLVRQTPKEGPLMRLDFESAIRALVAAGYIDSTRVGFSGWSYGGLVTDYMLTHSSIPFAAASKVDGGNRYYGEGNRAWTDAELRNVHPPFLMQVHSDAANLVAFGVLADRLIAMGKDVELLYLPLAPHGPVMPSHIQRALTMHTDWFRFWLQGYEDKAPAKRAQYDYWRSMRTKR
jgi:dipeptidyl aminopeptidase/acylaminoacyl peptidase